MPSSGQVFFASRAIVVVTLMVVGATRAPAFVDGVLAVDKSRPDDRWFERTR